MLVLFLKNILDFLKQKMVSSHQDLLLIGENTLRIIHHIFLVVELLQDFQQLDLVLISLNNQIKHGIKMQMELFLVDLVHKIIRLLAVKIIRGI